MHCSHTHYFWRKQIEYIALIIVIFFSLFFFYKIGISVKVNTIYHRLLQRILFNFASAPTGRLKRFNKIFRSRTLLNEYTKRICRNNFKNCRKLLNEHFTTDCVWVYDTVPRVKVASKSTNFIKTLIAAALSLAKIRWATKCNDEMPSTEFSFRWAILKWSTGWRTDWTSINNSHNYKKRNRKKEFTANRKSRKPQMASAFCRNES